MLDVIRVSTTKFWEAWLRDEAVAKSWLTNGGARAALGPLGIWEIKTAQPAHAR